MCLGMFGGVTGRCRGDMRRQAPPRTLYVVRRCLVRLSESRTLPRREVYRQFVSLPRGELQPLRRGAGSNVASTG